MASRGPSRESHALRRWLQTRERPLAFALLAFAGVLVLALGVWGVALGGAERAVDAWNARWIAKVDRGDELVRAGRHEEAVLYLEALDREFPAVFVKHALDKQRERLLTLLGTSYVALDRKGRAVETFERLVAFDPRNFANHFALAETYRHFADTDLADQTYLAVLAIHPNDVPSLTALVDMRFGVAPYPSVVKAFATYLDSWLLASVTLRAGERTLELELPADGREHVLDVSLDLAGGVAGKLELETHGYSVHVGAITFEPATRVGSARSLEAVALPQESAWTANDATVVEPGTFSATGPKSRLECALPALPNGAARVRIALTVYKAVPKGVWDKVQRSYRYINDPAGLEAVRPRVVVGGCLEAGSRFED